jgi:hypothetical protein
MISAIELALLLSAADGDQQAKAVQDLIERGLSTFAIASGAIVGMQNTPAGDAKLRGMTLPATTA